MESNFSAVQSDCLEEYERILNLLRAHGFNVEECAMIKAEEARATMFVNEPMEGYESITLPSTLAHCLNILVRVENEDMADFDIHDGDELLVKLQSSARTDDIVLIEHEGRICVRAYYRDRDACYLVPRSADIPLINAQDANIIGVVRKVMHDNLRANSYKSRMIIEQHKQKECKVITDEVLHSALSEIADSIKTKRQWFAVYRVLVDANVIYESEWTTFIDLVSQHTTHRNLDMDDLRRLNVMCFARPLAKWTREKSPCPKVYNEYVAIAQTFREMLYT